MKKLPLIFIEEELNKKYFKLISEFNGINKSIDVLCLKCNNISRNNFNNLINKNQGCKYCIGRGRLTDKIVINRLQSRKIKLIDFNKKERIIAAECEVCNHKWSAHCTNILNLTNPTNCPNCNGNTKISLEIVRNQLLKSNLELIGEYIGSNDKLSYRCIMCGYEGTNSYSNIKRQNQGCPKCKQLITYTNEEVDNILISRDKKLVRLEVIKKNSDKIKWICLKCKRNFCCSVTSIITQDANCPFCGCVSTSKKEDKWLDLMGIPTENRRYKINFNNKWIKVDGFDNLTNTVYEFYGDFWHGNPQKFNRDEINTVCKKTYGELYDKTMEREAFIKSKGFNLITIWEDDFNEVSI
jgi:hypothetical protein